MGIEVLSRWRQPDGTVLAPALYLPVAEQIGRLSDVDAALFHRTAREIAEIDAAGLHVSKVSFNVTAQRLQDPKVIELAREVAERSRFAIAFEILESVLLEGATEAFANALDLLREAGIGLQIDDFGSRHASIVALMEANPDCLKIDRQLVLPLPDSVRARKLLSAIVDIAAALEIGVIAEGVETADHARILAELGVETLQGYHFARPMPQAERADYLRRKAEMAAAS